MVVVIESCDDLPGTFGGFVQASEGAIGGDEIPLVSFADEPFFCEATSVVMTGRSSGEFETAVKSGGTGFYEVVRDCGISRGGG